MRSKRSRNSASALPMQLLGHFQADALEADNLTGPELPQMVEISTDHLGDAADSRRWSGLPRPG